MLSAACVIALACMQAAWAATITDLGTLGGTYSAAYGINASGQVVGWASTAGDAAFDAFLYTPGSGMTNLGTFGGPGSEATGINASGQVVGWASTAGNAQDAFLYTPGSGMIDLGPGQATGINDSGQVVGWLFNPPIPFLYAQGSGMIDLGMLLGSHYAWAYGINDSGLSLIHI